MGLVCQTVAAIQRLKQSGIARAHAVYAMNEQRGRIELCREKVLGSQSEQ